jgi:cell filamentation protein
MASKYRLESSDIYLPGTDVPKNRAGITETESLHEVERELIDCVQLADCSKLETIILKGLCT